MDKSIFKFSILNHYLPLIVSIIMTIFSILTSYESNLYHSIIYGIYILLFPGIYISYELKSFLKIDVGEFILCDVIISSALLTLLYLFLTQVYPSVTKTTLLASITFILTVTSILTHNKFSENDVDDHNIISLLPLLFAFIYGMMLNSLYVTKEYWRGCDGWETVTIIRGISELSLSYLETFDFYQSYVVLANTGFYHFLAAFQLVTGVLADAILRYGGLFQAGLFTALTYLIIKSSMGVLPGLVGTFLLMLNQNISFRLMVPFRENLAVFYLVTSIFLLDERQKTNQDISIAFIVVMTVLAGACLVTHPMTPFLIYAVLAFQAGYSYFKGLKLQTYEILISIILSIAISLPFITKMIIPITHMIQKSSSSSLIIFSILSVLIISGGIFLFKKRKDALLDLLSGQIFNSIVIMSVNIILYLNIFYPPNMHGVFNFNNMELGDFSKILIPFSIAGFIAFIRYSKNNIIKLLTLVLSFLTIPSYFGIPLPLGRIGFYIGWLMSYFAAYLIKTFMRSEFIVNFYDYKKMLSNLYEFITINKLTFFLIFIILTNGVFEISWIGSKQATFSYNDVEYTREFISELETNDLVLPYVLSEHLLYYNNAPRENLITNVTKEVILKQVFNLSSPYEISRVMENVYPDKTKLIIYVNSFYEHELLQQPCGIALKEYFKRDRYGSFIAYSLDIPFTLENTELHNVKFISDSITDAVLTFSNDDGWDCTVTEISNCLYNPGVSERRYLLYYIYLDSSNNKHLGLAYSDNGSTWEKHPEPLIPFEYDSIYVVKHEDIFYLFTVEESYDKIYMFESVDGLDWGNRTTVLDRTLIEGFWVYESPVAWVEDGRWNLIYWSSSLGETIHKGLSYSYSADGVNWVGPKTLNWNIMDDTYRIYDYEKIILNDVFRTDTGYVLLGKVYINSLDMSRKWRVGSFYLCNITDELALVKCPTFKDHLNQSDAIVRVFAFPRNGLVVPEFLYVIKDGSAKSVYLGAVADHLGIPEEFIVRP